MTSNGHTQKYMYRDKELKPLEGEERRKKMYKKKTMQINTHNQLTNIPLSRTRMITSMMHNGENTLSL